MAQADAHITGRIFDIQRFSVHDGPGIRTIVFCKGCFLRCRWCCNPESQSREAETLTLEGRTRTVGRDVTVAEVMDVVERDRPYYRRSGGGLTLSGGEALCQPDFATALLRAGKESGLHTAMESTAFAPFETIAPLLPYLDVFLLDIKHVDSEKHKAFTSQPNARILANAQRLAVEARQLVIRVPVIPTFNDTPQEIEAIARFAAGLPRVTRLHLLPYHRLGTDKYAGLGRVYTMPDALPPTQAHMERLLHAAEHAGKGKLACQIGG